MKLVSSTQEGEGLRCDSLLHSQLDLLPRPFPTPSLPFPCPSPVLPRPFPAPSPPLPLPFLCLSPALPWPSHYISPSHPSPGPPIVLHHPTPPLHLPYPSHCPSPSHPSPTPPFVPHHLTPSLASVGSLKPGDVILAINGRSLGNATLQEAAEMLKTSADVVTLTISKDIDYGV